MKHFGNQLNEIIKKKNIKQKELAIKLGITEVTLTKWKSQNSIDASKLENISRILNIPIISWFDDVSNGNQTITTKGKGNAASIYGDAVVGEMASKDKEIEHLKSLLDEKEKALQDKERTIQILMNK
jgi:transcriptional regulator with XRE-family HTH domain